MIVSVHLAEVGALRAQRMLFSAPSGEVVPGLTYAEPALTVPLGGRLPSPRLGRIGMIAGWEDDDALDRFLGEDRFGRALAPGWHVRLTPLRCFGKWDGLPGLPKRELPVADDEPVVALTLGRLRLLRLRGFLAASAPAERDAVADPAVLASTAFARPGLPPLVSTFSIWQSAAAMREYAFSQSGSHQAAVRADRDRPFHHESAFVRFRPYASAGSWDGRDPLAKLIPAVRSATPAGR
jgi:hypothetical protein